AADPEIRDRVRVAVAFGGYYDLRETLEYVITGPESPIAYLKWVYLGANSDLVADEGDRQQLRKFALDRGATIGELSPDAQALLGIFLPAISEVFHLPLHAGLDLLNRRLDALSPSH